MKKYLIATILVAVAAVSGALMGGNVARSAGQGDGQHVVVHLSKFTDNLHAAFMAFNLAEALQTHGATVTVLLDFEGVRIADRGNSLDLRWGSNQETFAEVYTKFVRGGGTVILCPHCADAAGVDRTALRDGAKVGVMEDHTIPKLLLEADKILDY